MGGAFGSGVEMRVGSIGTAAPPTAHEVSTLGVAAGGVVVMCTGWGWVDPAVSIALTVTILVGTWSLMRSARFS